MTEEEARTKECCGPEGCGRRAMHQFPTQNQNAYGSAQDLQPMSTGQPLPRYCTGSACMAWRHMRADWSAKESIVDMVKVQGGYCGHAGKP